MTTLVPPHVDGGQLPFDSVANNQPLSPLALGGTVPDAAAWA
jgi:hypothetical protein